MAMTMDNSIQHYRNEYQRVAKQLAAADQAWLVTLRGQALAHFTQAGFPSQREEDWKYTNVTPIIKQAYQYAAAAVKAAIDLTPKAVLNLAPCYQLTFVNGHFSPALSKLDNLPPGVQITSLATYLAHNPSAQIEQYLGQLAPLHRSSFTALNTSFLQDGAYIYLPTGTVLSQPIHCVYIHTAAAQMSFTPIRNLIIAEANSQAKIIESYQAAASYHYFTNVVTELMLGAHAQVEHYKWQQESSLAAHIGTLYVKQQQHSCFSGHSFAVGGHLVRSDTEVLLSEEFANCQLNGLYLGQGRQHIDHHTVIDHAAPHGSSQECYKGVLTQQAHGVFNGKVMVRPGAYKTNARQTNKNLLLSPQAEINSKPELEIYNDDVQCTHGATTGQLDEAALFYLRARGLEMVTARNALIYAFARELVENIPNAPIRATLQSQVSQQLAVALPLET